MSGSSSTTRILLGRGLGLGSAIGGPLERQDEREGAARAGRALHLGAAGVRLHDVLDQRQPEATALRLVHQRILRAIELLEDLALLVALDPDPLVRHRDQQAPVPGPALAPAPPLVAAVLVGGVD